MEKILSLTEPVVLFRQREKKEEKDQVFAEWVPTLPATGNMQFMFPTKHCPTV